MFVFIKAQFSALIATLIDFLVTVFCVEIMGVRPVYATVAGAVFGAITNFMLGRVWVFKAKAGNTGIQLFKYGLVWLGSVALNALGMLLLNELMDISYIYSKIVISLIVGIGYNFLLQKNVVFRTA